MMSEPPQRQAEADIEAEQPGAAAASKENALIKIYARIRPNKRSAAALQPPQSKRLILDGPLPQDGDQPQLHFVSPRKEEEGLINNSKEMWDFRFDRVLPTDVGQEEVWDVVAKDVVDSYASRLFPYTSLENLR